MSDLALAGAPLALERRTVPAAAAAFSVALHAVILATGIPFLGGRAPVRPRPVAALDELAVSLERPPPPAVEPRRRTVRRAEPRRPAEVGLPRPEPEPPPEVEPPEAERAALERVVSDDALDPPESKPVSRPAFAEAPGGVRAARLIAGEARPRYPAGCRDGSHAPGGCEGRGSYEVEVDATGRVLSADVAASAGCRELDRAALRFLRRRARFAPAEMDGVPVPWKGAFAVTFRLEDARSEAHE